MVTRRVLLAAESLVAGNGGICRVARLIARVLGEMVEAEGLAVDALALSDDRPATDLGLSARTTRGSRLRYVWRVGKSALGHTHFIYDFAGMARAHVRLPILRRPFLTFIHGIEVWEGARPDRLRVARAADLLLSNSRYTLERAQGLHGGLSHARVCWLATETDEAPTVSPPSDSPPSALILGRVDEALYKGHSDLVDVWPTVVDAVPDARLVIVGRGPGLHRLRDRISASSAAARIEVRGFVPEDRIDAVWAESTVFAMPSRGEGFGLAYIEAMRNGLPVVASVHDAAPEINLDGETGYNVDLDRRGALVDRIIPLLRDRDLAARLGAAGRRRWGEHFRYGAFRARFLPTLKEFLGSSSPPEA